MRQACLLVLMTPLAAAQQVPQEMPKWVVPSFADLTLKIRDTRGLMTPQVETLYFKGARQRIEHGPEGSKLSRLPFLATIMECDARTIVRLRPQSKTYTTSVAHEPPDRNGKERPRLARPADGALVTVTIHSEDTGETRQIGGYQARRLKTTIAIEPSKGAGAKPGKIEADSWYLDIPGLYCRADDTRSGIVWGRLYMQLLSHQFAEHHDNVQIKVSGPEPRGLLIEETAKAVSDGNEITSKTELLSSSSDPLDQSLFEIPADFTEAQPGHQFLRGNPAEN